MFKFSILDIHVHVIICCFNFYSYKTIYLLLKILNGKRNVQIIYNMTNFANFLFIFNRDTRKHIGTFENTERKLIKCELAILFKNTCLNENIFMNIDIYIYIDRKAYASWHDESPFKPLSTVLL